MTAAISGPAWDLSDEYSGVDDSALASDLDALGQMLEEVERLNADLEGAAAVAAAQQIAKLSEQCGRLLANVSTFAHCLLSVDAQHEGAQKLNGSLQTVRKRFGDAFKPHSQFVDNANESTIAAYLADPEVAPAQFIVEHGRKRRHENLTLAEESLVNGLSQDGIHAWGNLYDQLAGSLQCQVVIGNEETTMGVAEASGLLGSDSDAQRRNAWTGINNAWEGHEESCAAALKRHFRLAAGNVRTAQS